MPSGVFPQGPLKQVSTWPDAPPPGLCASGYLILQDPVRSRSVGEGGSTHFEMGYIFPLLLLFPQNAPALGATQL